MQVTRRQAISSLGAILSLSVLSPASMAGRRAPSPEDAAGFLAAVRAGELERVQELLRGNPDLARAVADDGRSAFVLAHVHGHGEIADHLLSTGLELDIVESVLNEDWDRFELLAAEHPELVNSVHPIGGTPLYAAALVGSHGAWYVRAQGGLPEVRPAGGTGFTPARGALESSDPGRALIGLTDLLGNGADVNAAQAGGSSVLHAAVGRRDEALVRVAIRKGADVEALDDRGRTPRALATELEWTAGERLLAGHLKLPRDNRSSRFALDANREPVVRPDLTGLSRALQHEVTSSSHFNMPRLRELVATDERLIFSVSGDDELAIEACGHIGNRDIIRFHLDHGAPLSLPTAISLGDFEAVEYWLERAPTLIHERGAHDFPVMWYAVVGGASIEMAELLVHHGADVDQESMGSTALHLCAAGQDGPRDVAGRAGRQPRGPGLLLGPGG